MTAIVEGNSLNRGAFTWSAPANFAMLRVDIIDNDLHGSNLNTARLIDIGSSTTAPKQLRIRGNRGFKRVTTTAGT